MRKIDLIVTVQTAVDNEGHLLRTGGGRGDIEYAILREYGLATDEMPIVAISHPLLIVPNIPFDKHDMVCDYIVTPEKIIKIKEHRPKPKGVYWEDLPEERLKENPTLQRLKQSLRWIKTYEDHWHVTVI